MNTTEITISQEDPQVKRVRQTVFTVTRFNRFSPDEKTEAETVSGNLRAFIRHEKREGRNVIVRRPQ